LIFHGYSEVVCQSKGRQEKIMMPDNIPESQRYKYSHLDPTTGIVRVGETVTTGDVLVGKVSINAAGQVKNESLFVEVGKRGVIDNVVITENAEACKLIRIRIREFRKIQPGDKFASRYSQKGTIGAVMPGDQIPWVVSDNPALNGLRPHIIFNPHGIPSRMTIGKLFEMLTGILTGVTGERYNATAFRRYNYLEVQDQLEKLGFSRTGKSSMVNGITGRQMDVDIFIGPVYYQLLRHLVEDKMQARGTGSIQFWTRQPTSGIRKEGGLRLGEMERDVLIEYGAAYLTQERMSISSDAWQGVVCQECGQFAINNVERGDFRCRMCKHGEFVMVKVPYSFKLMSQLLSAANIKLTLRSKDS
jgi:DNA-directed RNA polymerase subunit B